MDLPPEIHINPPLLNSANPWATTLEDLRALFACPSTGAVTTRTTLLNGFAHNPDVHKYAFFSPNAHQTASLSTPETRFEGASASLNNMGYSPIPLDEYISYIKTISEESKTTKPNRKGKGKGKTFIISVTGSPKDVAICYKRITRLKTDLRKKGDREEDGGISLAMEINLSCPNIPGAPPPAYSEEALGEYLDTVGRMAAATGTATLTSGPGGRLVVPWGIKTPPYTHAGEFGMLIEALVEAGRRYGVVCPVSFVTATNTLGSCLVLEPKSTASVGVGNKDFKPSLADDKGMTSGIGGMAGAPLHPLALGNVASIRRMLDENVETRHVKIIGVGGVEDADGYRRMRHVGAAAVGVGTAFGRKGVSVFGEIEEGLKGEAVW
ncbi:dihydroorotate dehydrogenase [Hypoxylon trugodes]|uniref:dihydroorotate dehydrogenase n=1 Tax=Hypoxylon trugodes TaxID=326681 RepID=UPI00219556A4|nr:dihydroorotate dehydrogenase [Hypoxylon trugodes]KAI1389724.1 dihydroorotate dehydrogenase [Hypoxylon trugodes]